MEQLIRGRKPVLEALKAGRPIERILVHPGARGTVVDEIRAEAARRRIPVSPMPRPDTRERAAEEVTQGVVAVTAPRKYADLEEILAVPGARGEQGCILLLDEIEDPQNLGALVRTAVCAGLHGVVIPRHHAAGITAAVVKASAGATEHIAIAEVTNIVNTVEELKQKGYWIVGLDAAGDRPFTDVDYTAAVALVVGNEGKGIRRLVREHCDYLVKIPLLGSITSLNASVAGGLVMYETVRQRRRP